MSLLRIVIAGTLLMAGRATATAHPQASPDRNNRYLKVTPMADRLRLAYTIYLGEQPGAQVRRRLDRDRSGTIDDREAAVVGDELGAQIRPAVELSIDGRAVAIDWSAIDVGLGTPATTAGSFSVDLIGWACTGGGEQHALALRDRVRLDRPGEIEVRLEDGPGITFGARRLGGDPMPDLIATWRGDESRLATGLDLDYRVDLALAVAPDDGRCGADTGTSSKGRLTIVAAVAGAGLIAAALYVTRRRRSSRSVA